MRKKEREREGRRKRARSCVLPPPLGGASVYINRRIRSRRSLSFALNPCLRTALPFSSRVSRSATTETRDRDSALSRGGSSRPLAAREKIPTSIPNVSPSSPSAPESRAIVHRRTCRLDIQPAPSARLGADTESLQSCERDDSTAARTLDFIQIEPCPPRRVSSEGKFTRTDDRRETRS
jgi:hypothetical protein